MLSIKLSLALAHKGWPSMTVLESIKAKVRDCTDLLVGIRGALAISDLAEAERLSRTLLELVPASSVTHMYLGIIAARRHDGPQAVLHLLQATQLDPSNPHLRFLSGTAFVAAGLLGPARRQARWLQDRDPNDSRWVDLTLMIDGNQIGKWDDDCFT